MQLIDYTEILPSLRNLVVQRPQGALAGHATGAPFEKAVYAHLKALYPKMIYKQYEFLNDLYRSNPTVIGAQGRKALFDSPVALFLLSRSDTVTARWTPTNIFEEKQSDTADIVAHRGGQFDLIDIKTHNLHKHSQVPNIISAYKLAQTCACMFDNNRFDDVSLNYIEIGWEEQSATELICKTVAYASLFLIPPEELYINWAAAIQIQFYVHNTNQSFDSDVKTWAKSYLAHYVKSAQKRCDAMQHKFIAPFKKYL